MSPTYNSSIWSSNSSSHRSPAELQKAFFEAYYVSFISYIAAGSCICLFAVSSNIICFAAICTYPPLMKRGSVLVANLTAVSILLSCTSYPITLVQILYRQYKPLSENFCDWNIYYYFSIHSFMWHECLIAFNRFVAVVLPYRYNVVSTKSVLIATVIGGYLIAFVINAYPIGITTHMFVSSPPFGGCVYNRQHEGHFPAVHVVLGVYLPMSLIGMCYATLFSPVLAREIRARFSIVRSPDLIQSRHVFIQKKRVQLARMLFGSFIWNVLTYLPQPLVQAFLPDAFVRYPTVFFYIRVTSLLGVAGNAVIYAFLNPDYRHGMLAVLNCRKIRLVAPTTSGRETNIVRRNPVN